MSVTVAPVGQASQGLSDLTLAVTEYAAEATFAMASDEDLVAELRQLEQVRRRLEAVDDPLLTELDRRGLGASCGARSTAGLLQDTLRLSPRAARLRVLAARHLGSRMTLTGDLLPPVLPAVAAAREAGVISGEHVSEIVAVMTQLPPDLPVQQRGEAEQILLTVAVDCGPRAVSQIGQQLLDTVNPDGQEPSDTEQDRLRTLSLRRRRDGAYDLSGRLTPECGVEAEAVLAALAAPRPAVDDAGAAIADERSPSQRLHDGFQDLLGLALRADTLPYTGRRAHLILTGTTDIDPAAAADFGAAGAASAGECGAADVGAAGAASAGECGAADFGAAGAASAGECGAADFGAAGAASAGECGATAFGGTDECASAGASGGADFGAAGAASGVDSSAAHFGGTDECASAGASGGADFGAEPGSHAVESAAGGVEFDAHDGADRRAEAGSGREAQPGGHWQADPQNGQRPAQLGRLARTVFGQALHMGTAMRLCDTAQVTTVILTTAGQVLDYGRSRRFASPGQLHALFARDGGCSFPNCDQPPIWCDAHHVIEWAHGGPTNISNLTLLCGYHHRTFGRLGWKCYIANGLPLWIPPFHVDPTRKPRRNLRYLLRQ